MIGAAAGRVGVQGRAVPNVTGGFGEQSCHLCHLDNPINAPGGAVDVDGVPPALHAGPDLSDHRHDQPRRTAPRRIRDCGAVCGREAERPQAGLAAADARAQLIPGAVDKALTFVQHNLAGSRRRHRHQHVDHRLDRAIGRGRGRAVQRRANASNNDDSPLGDYIYLKRRQQHAQK